MQYTIRGIPALVDHAIRERARAAGKSLNEAAVDALAEGAGVAGTPRKRRDLGDIAGTWKADKALESALAAQDRVDEDLLAVRVALDANRYVDLCKGVAETVALLEDAEAIVLPFVVIGELRAGFAHGRRQAENERITAAFPPEGRRARVLRR